jgi:hypothetical protein
VEKHHARLQVKSSNHAPRTGSVFSLLLPCDFHRLRSSSSRFEGQRPHAMSLLSTAQRTVAIFEAWRNMTLCQLLHRSILVTGRAMQCPEQLRLEQLYEAALRRWAQVSMPIQLDGERAYLAEQVRLRVMRERNAAKDRLRYHRLYCSACRHKFKRNLRPLEK